MTEMEFVDKLTGEKVWGEVVYDSSEGFRCSWEDFVDGWYMTERADCGKQDLWKAANKAFEQDLLEVVTAGDEPIGLFGPVLRQA